MKNHKICGRNSEKIMPCPGGTNWDNLKIAIATAHAYTRPKPKIQKSMSLLNNKGACQWKPRY